MLRRYSIGVSSSIQGPADVRCRQQQRVGFTLLEVILALAIAAVVVLMARQLLVQLALSDSRLDAASRVEAEARNSSRFLTELLSRAEVGTDSSRTFTGEVSRVDFASWCAAPRGWMERCGVSLVVDTLVHPSPLALITTRGDTLILKRSGEGTQFRYLSDPEDPQTWTFRWGRGVTAPAGIAIVTPVDTTRLRVGPRG